jgi:hypothetical protein
MGALTEQEIFDRMVGCVRGAIDSSVQLASSPHRGYHYDCLRKNLRLAGNCCRQAAQWREDARWLNWDKELTSCHKRAGDWLRGYRDEAGERIHFSRADINELFTLLAQALSRIHNAVIDMRDRATARRGMILPLVHRETRTEGRSVGVLLPPGMMQRASGLVVPETVH